MIDTRMWKAACPICKWSTLVYSQEGAQAAKLAHEQIKGHKSVTVQPVEERATMHPLTGRSA
jgi:hypothetical protein